MGTNGALANLVRQNAEAGVQQYVRQWKHTNLEGHDEDISYRFRSAGFDIDFGSTPTQLQLHSKWTTTTTLREDGAAAFSPHPSVHRFLLTLLQQYAEQATSPIVRNAFAQIPIDVTGMQVVLHECVDIAASGYFRGYQSTMSIHATNRYGADHRNRYDVVELTIPSDAGGPIASSRELVRPSEDSALALVVGVVTIRYGEKETCLLQVMFFRTAQKNRQQKWLAKTLLPRFVHMQYGAPNAQWLAVYPLVTLRGPALKIEDPHHPNHFLLYCSQYMSRGLWEGLPTEQTRLTWHPALPRSSFSAATRSDNPQEQEEEP